MIEPILHRIVLKLDNVETKTEAGIIIPDMVTEKERKAVEIGTVVSIGSTCYKDYGADPNIVKVGDRVIIAKYSGKEVKDIDDTPYVICNDEDIICILRGEKNE